MYIQPLSANTASRNSFVSSAQNQAHLDTGSLRTSTGAAALAEEDRVSLSGALVSDMEDDEVQSLLSSTLAQFGQSGGDALAAHSGLDMSRALSLLDGLDF